MRIARRKLRVTMLILMVIALVALLLLPRPPSATPPSAGGTNRSPQPLVGTTETREVVSPKQVWPTDTRGDARPSGKATECSNADEMQDLIHRLVSECSEPMLGAGCLPPLRAGSKIPNLLEKTQEELRTSCPADVAASLSLDCATLPCLVLSSEEAEEDARQCLRHLLPVDESVAIGTVPVAWGLSASDRATSFYSAPLQLEAPQRLRRLRRSLDRGYSSSSVATSLGCSEASVPEAPHERCGWLIEALGCEPDPKLAMTEREVNDYLADMEDLVRQHEAHCPGFADAEWYLECKDLPCRLVVVNGPTFSGDIVEELGCGHVPWGTAYSWVVQDLPQGPVAVVRLQAGWEGHPALDARYDARSTAQDVRALHAYEPPGTGIWGDW